MKYQVITKDGRAKRAQMETVHGTIQTPVFMNVGTVAAIKGAVSTEDLEGLGRQVELSFVTVFWHLCWALWPYVHGSYGKTETFQENKYGCLRIRHVTFVYHLH